MAYTDWIYFITSINNATNIAEAMNFSTTGKPASQGSITDSIPLGSGHDKNGVSGTISYKAVYNNTDWYVLEFDLQ